MEDNKIVEILQEANEYVTQGERGAAGGTECNAGLQTKRSCLLPLLTPPPPPLPAVTRPRDVAVDAELFNFLAESGLEYLHKLKQVGAGRARGCRCARALRRWTARRVPPATLVSLLPGGGSRRHLRQPWGWHSHATPRLQNWHLC